MALDSNPVLTTSYHWDSGDGTETTRQDGAYTYTLAGNHSVNLIVKGIEGLSAHRTFSITAIGTVNTRYGHRVRRYTGPYIK